MAAFALPIARELGITAPLLAHHGAAIVLPASGRVLGHTPLEPAVAREAIEWSADHGLLVHLNRLDELIMRADDRRAEAYGRLLGVEPRLVDDLRAALDPPVTKVMAGEAPGRPPALFEPARAAFRGRASITISNPRFLEFLGPEVSKGRAVEWLAARSGVPLAQTLAIGDSLSDLDMLTLVGHPVAMANAPDAVKAVARHIAPPIEEDGVAHVLEALVLAVPA
jgi:Cof subfamily protein (haloacid dehalogenase superfamily)